MILADFYILEAGFTVGVLGVAETQTDRHVICLKIPIPVLNYVWTSNLHSTGPVYQQHILDPKMIDLLENYSYSHGKVLTRRMSSYSAGPSFWCSRNSRDGRFD